MSSNPSELSKHIGYFITENTVFTYYIISQEQFGGCISNEVQRNFTNDNFSLNYRVAVIFLQFFYILHEFKLHY